MPEREMMSAPPSGLCACRLGDEYVHIAAISPRCVIVRLPEGKTPAGRLTLHLYRMRQGRWEAHTIPKYQAGGAQRQSNAALFRLRFDDAACAGAIRDMLNAYARFLETKSTLGASAWAEAIAGYPADEDEVFHSSLVQQRDAWFHSYPALPEPREGISLAVELNCPQLWELYLAQPLRDFMAAYAAARQLPNSLLPRRLPDRLYIGNAFCSRLFPRGPVLSALLEKAGREHLDITLVTAEMQAGCEASAERIISLAQSLRAELMVNDWGLLHRARGRCALLLGPLLNKRRKDPRLACKPGAEKNLLARGSLHFDPWRQALASMGVQGYAWESCALPTDLPPGINCLHLPFYQTNTSRWCPLQALCLRGDRSAQQPSQACSLLCEENTLIYPAHLNMLGRWNSIFALAPAPEPALMQRFDRWVYNF